MGFGFESTFRKDIACAPHQFFLPWADKMGSFLLDWILSMSRPVEHCRHVKLGWDSSSLRANSWEYLG